MADQRRVAGLLSVVVPCYQVEAFLDECLESLRAQAYDNVEIIVVDDGSPDRSGEIARQHAAADPRVHVVTRENGGLSAARNTGIDHARGEFLTFVDADDVVTPEAYTSAIAALHESGSDFVVACYDRLEDGQRVPAAPWIRAAHRVRRLAADLDTFPEVMVNAVAWSKTYRREFWDRAGLRFPEGRIYEDQPVSAAAYAQSRAFDVIPEVGVSWRIRTDRSSISQDKQSADNLRAHNESVRASFKALASAGKQRAVQVRALQLILHNLSFFTRHLVVGGPGFWPPLREGVLDLLARVSRDELVTDVAAQDKVLLELIAADRRDDAAFYVGDPGVDPRSYPTRRTDGQVRVDLPRTDGLPDDVCHLSERQLRLEIPLLEVTRDADGLTVSGGAFIRFFDLAATVPHLHADLVSRDGSTRLPMLVDSFVEPRLRDPEDQLRDYTPGGFRARLPAHDVPGDLERRWRLELTLSVGGLTRTAKIPPRRLGWGQQSPRGTNRASTSRAADRPSSRPT
jgi:CDP-glycerol glycerophosphotransferase